MKSSWFNKKRILLITASVVIIVVLCVGIFALKDNMSSGPQKDGSNITVSSAEDAATHLKELGDDIGYKNALSELTEKNTTTIDGDSYYRLQQTYQGIPVYGRSVVCVTDKTGETVAITGNVLDIDESINLTPTVTMVQVQETVGIYLSDVLGVENINEATNLTLNTDRLCIYKANATDEACLVYCFQVDGYELVVDANSGEVYTARELMTDATGYLVTDKECENGFHIETNENGEYILQNSEIGVLVLNLNGKTSEKTENFANSTYITSKDIIFGNDIGEEDYLNAVYLYNNITAISNLYRQKCSFECECIFGFFNDGYDRGKNATGGRYVEKDGKYYGCITLGSTTGVSDIDVLAHEFGHVISYKIVDWTGTNVQTGAINEALSDIYGEIAESWIFEKSPDWIMIGDNIDVKRNIIDPSQTKNASKVGEKSWQLIGEDDDKYYQSTIISHAAYLMWNGINGDNAKQIDADDLAKLWYRAMLMMPSDCDFAECRTLVELAAVSMGLSDAQIACVKEAFDTVGINNSETVDYELSSSATLSVYGADANLYSDYTMQIAGTQTIWNQDADPTTDDIYNYYIYFRQNTTTEKYYETRHITTAEPVSLDLKYGAYTITLIDDKGLGSPVSFKIKVGSQNGKDNLDIYTNFVVGNSQQETPPGTNATEPGINGPESNDDTITYYIGSTRGFSNGVAWVEARQKENGVIVETQWACIDASGNVLFMLDPNTFEPSSFANGVSLCKTHDSDYEVNAYNIIDKSGNIVFSSTDGSFDAVIACSDGYFAVYTYTESFREAGYTVFFMNYKGEVTKQIDGLRTKIPELINCGGGVFAEKIRQNADAAVTYRFYDAKTGNEYEVGGISSHKSMSYIFHNGYAVIEGKRMGDIPKLVSTDGQITELKQFGYGSFYDFGPVSDGGFVCTCYYQDKVEWVKFYDISTGTLTRLGNYGERVELNRATGFRFDNGSMLLPLVGADGKNYYTIVDKSGQSLFDPVVCKYADAEGDNRILVKFEDKTVAYNGRGETIFELPAGQSVDSYQDGVARLVGSDYAISNTYIDLYGKPIFDSDILLFKSKK